MTLHEEMKPLIELYQNVNCDLWQYTDRGKLAFNRTILECK